MIQIERRSQPVASWQHLTCSLQRVIGAALPQRACLRGPVLLSSQRVPLQPQERQACVDARLSPPHYLAIKATLMREAERLGGPPPRERVRVPPCVVKAEAIMQTQWDKF